MRDFTLTACRVLLDQLREADFRFMTFAEYLEEKPTAGRLVILRHDVDRQPLRSLRVAEMENERGIKGTYYFRTGKRGFSNKIIEKVSRLEHEIGYHYDDLNDAGGDIEKALALFQKNLSALRECVPVKTACMHGSPMSRFDNRDLWKHANYREFGIIGEPYFDIDFSELMYLTDTGRRWDGDKVSIRDRVSGYGESRGQKTEDREEMEKGSKGAVGDQVVFSLHSTLDIINALEEGRFPEKTMLTIHPQRWNDELLPWVGELVGQKIKNVAKYFIVKKKASR